MLHQAAGYREKEEIDELIYRTVGRVPESEFLFRRFLLNRNSDSGTRPTVR